MASDSQGIATFSGNSGDLRALVQRELERLLEAAEFRQSEQSKRLLQYLVVHSLDGSAEGVRERAIGAALFGLESGYDTNQNPIVRVRANEVRKRLARYYARVGPQPLQVEIPAGGYRAEFRQEAAAPETALPVPEAALVEEPAGRRHPGPGGKALYLGLLLAAAAVAVLVFSITSGAPSDSLEAFWQPALDAPSPVIICAGHPVVYRFSSQFQKEVTGRVASHYEVLTRPLNLDPDQVLHARDIVPVPNQYIGLGSAEAVAQIHGWLARRKKDSTIRFGNDLTFTDFRNSPAVVIGAFQNKWMIELTKNLRFIFDTAGGRPEVRDTQTGKTWSLPGLKEDGQTTEDYVLISRLLNSASGEFVVAAAGITQYGGHTVGEVLSDPQVLNKVMKTAKSGWKKRSQQLLFHVQVIGATAGPPQLIAFHEW
ncbi:MAG: hypothetical protein ABI822_22805 [Bryobacteraceae bacterium]